MEFRNTQQETRKEVVGKLKARGKDGTEHEIEEVIPSTRTRDADGNWSEWEAGPKQYWFGKIFCNRTGEKTFEPLMTDEVLTLVD